MSLNKCFQLSPAKHQTGFVKEYGPVFQANELGPEPRGDPDDLFVTTMDTCHPGFWDGRSGSPANLSWTYSINEE